jgi:hypothetical protein
LAAAQRRGSWMSPSRYNTKLNPSPAV